MTSDEFLQEVYTPNCVSTEKPTCAICHKDLTAKKRTKTSYGTLADMWTAHYNGQRIDFEFESFWVCNDCLEEVKHE